MSQQSRRLIIRALGLVVLILIGALLSDSIGRGFGQPTGQGQVAPSMPAPPATPGSTPAPSPTPPTVAAPIKETKETKETKEIKDHPSDWVEFAGAIAWPLCLLLIVLVLLFSKTGRRMFGLFPRVVRKISAGGVEMEISADAVEQVREYLRDSFDELVARAKDEYQRMASVQQISNHLSRIIDNALPRVLAANQITALPANVRSTIHVPDIVFSSYLYQLVNYYPNDDRPGGSAHRRFSQRFGIIGRCWRLGESMGRGNAVAVGSNATRQLIEQWGMMRSEVSQTRGRPADLCVILRNDEHLQIGILFVDSTTPDGFGSDEVAVNVVNTLETEAETLALSRALERVLAPLRVAAPDLEITRTLQ
jgi:hypothetical protein